MELLCGLYVSVTPRVYFMFISLLNVYVYRKYNRKTIFILSDSKFTELCLGEEIFNIVRVIWSSRMLTHQNCFLDYAAVVHKISSDTSDLSDERLFFGCL